MRNTPQYAAPSQPYQTDANGYAQAGYQPSGYAAHGYEGDYTDHVPEDYGYAEPVEDYARPKLGAAQWGGAVMSLALIVGLGVWGYNLMVRDVRGVPVIRALEGSARILPDDPGGQLAMHQGLAVNSVTTDGSAAAPADRYVLAPAATGLSDEDQPMGQIGAPVLASYEPTSEAYSVKPQPMPANTVADNVEAIMVEESPLELAEIDTVGEVEAPLVTNAMRSPLPKLRPADVPNVQLASLSGSASLNGVADDILAAMAMPREMSADDVPTGASLVQLGAFQSEDVARTEWVRLSARFEDLMGEKTRVIEQAESGGKTFYRLRAFGFADASDANRFCSALTSMNAACVPTVQR
ncbi:SPOR domain-containing protein [Celeribacter litoreus]|uniref:SPOR domain-containing protein n=1 Tax=Celeribacter litoreus TaxID=2876714 RepID=UPI001CCC7649|nr:SPOR domain-containing protein [Celeribacter litoreus]MCA0043676.1 SPOR domain-containing protein [Celeribacter litoreus]